MLACD